MIPAISTSNRHLVLPGGKELSLAVPVVMGILNVTPDSFSDGGRFISLDGALAQAERMISEGVGIIDIGGESSRPGASPVSAQDEQARVIPVITALTRRFATPVSIDTYHADTAAAALDAGASLVNDITALQSDPLMISVVRKSTCPVILMHMQGTPQTMQRSPHYDDVVGEVISFFRERISTLEAEGISSDRLVIDPGIGFGKRLEDNLNLLKHLDQFAVLGVPIMIGVSRKSFIQKIDPTAHEPSDRLGGSLAATMMALQHGAKIIRAHDVRETVQAIHVWERIAQA